MKIDRFMLATSGLVDGQGEIGDETRAVLSESAEAFLRAGGVLSFSDWEAFSQETRAAFVDANERVWAERAFMIGVASQGVDGAATIIEKVDGGDTRIRLALDRAVVRSLSRMGVAH